MRVTLVHNPDAGSGDHLGTDLLARLRDAGHEAVYMSTEAAALTRALQQHPDVVLAAGGDGTIGAVARLMVVHSPTVPLAILPVGTANNIAASLDVHGAVDDIVAGLDSDARRALDIATAHAPWGTVKFVESAGVGAFAAMLRDAERDTATGADSRDPAPNERGARFRRALGRTRPRRWHVEADGEDLSGDYLLVMLLNTEFAGPNLALATEADPGDGRLDLLLVREEDRQALGGYLERLSGTAESALAIPTRRVTRARLGWSAPHGHIDDHLWPEAAKPDDGAGRATGIVEIDAAGSSIPILVPRLTAAEATPPSSTAPPRR
jgi:diacylglycerol kinase family enzyme